MNSEFSSVKAEASEPGVKIVYDGACPFCSRYVALLRLRESVGPVELIDARSSHPLVDAVTRRGFDIDEGMVAKVGSAYYGGADCMHVLGMMSTRSGVFNRTNHRIFKSATLSRILYPALLSGRNFTLRLLGRKKIAS